MCICWLTANRAVYLSLSLAQLCLRRSHLVSSLYYTYKNVES